MESTHDDIEYWRVRAAIEREAAKTAQDPRVRQVHDIMAMRYEAWVNRPPAEDAFAA